MYVCSVTSNVFDSLSLPGSSVHWIIQARVLEWVSMPFSREFSKTRNQTRVSCTSCTAGKIFTTEPQEKPCREPAWESPSMTRSCRRALMGKASQSSRGSPLDLPERLPQNQNLSVLLFYDFHQLL